MAMNMSGQSTFIQLFKPPLDPSIRKRYRKKERISVDEQPHDFKNAEFKLSLNLKLTRILSSPPTGIFSNWGEGVSLSQRLAKLLRHDLPQSGLTFTGDGAVLLDDVLQLWRNNGFHCTEEKVIAACNPAYGNGKTRVIVGEVIGQGKFVCAVGGHSFELHNCIGTQPMSMAEAKKTKYAFHVTKSRREVERSGYLSKMQRNGIHCFYMPSSGRNHAYFQEGDRLKIDLEAAMQSGIEFHHNLFSDIILGMGKWQHDSHNFDGRIPSDFYIFE